MTPSNKLHILLEAALLGGQAALRNLPGAERQVMKALGDFATTADLEAERCIMEFLKERFPGTLLLAEESWNGDAQLPADFISIDPFDGTIIGSLGANEWGVLLALVKNGETVAAVAHQPLHQRSLLAERGKGTYLIQHRKDLPQALDEAERLHYSTGRQIAPDERWVSCCDFYYATNADSVKKYFLPLIEQGKILLNRSLGASIANCYELLSGITDLYINVDGGKIWDFAATALMIEEAGGLSLEVRHSAIRKFKPDTLAKHIIFLRCPEMQDDFLKILGVYTALKN